MYRKHIATIFFCSVLIFSIYSIPNQIGDAYGHRSDSHKNCWWLSWNLGPLIIAGITIVVQLVMIALAPFTFGASLTGIPTVDLINFGAQIIAIPIAFLAVAGCGPQIVAPAQAAAGQSHLDCTSSVGFRFTNISSKDTEELTFTKTDSRGTTFHQATSHEIVSSDEEFDFPLTLPVTLVVSAVGNLVLALFILIFFLLLDLALLAIPNPPSSTFGKLAFMSRSISTKAFFKMIGKFALGALAQLAAGSIGATLDALELAGVIDTPGDFILPDVTVNKNPDVALSYHPLDTPSVTIKDTVTEEGVQDKVFTLGKNKLEYKTLQTGDLITGGDEDTFPINVYDNEPPRIDFTTNKHPILEANAHYGFKVDHKSLPLLKNGIEVSDNCTQEDEVIPKYIGNRFFLVSSLKEKQYAQWMVQDNTPKEKTYYSLTPLDVAIGQRELSDFQTVFGDNPEKRTAQISPSEHVNFTLPKEGFSSLRHLFVKVANSEINELIEIQKKRSKLPPTADVTIGGDLIDFTTNDKISIVGVEQETITITGQVEDIRQVSTDSLLDADVLAILGVSQQNFNNARDSIMNAANPLLAGLNRDNRLGEEMAEPNVFVDFQNVTVLDTIPPNILVTEDLAVTVNSTHPSNNNSTLVDNERGGCIKKDGDFTCALKIRPPAVFDIADPFPIISENFTNNGVFTPIENELFGNFSLGVSTIGWKAVDFTGNGNKTKDVVTQFVNLKLNGTNKISIVYDVNATVFSTVPQQITIIANNTDQDPLKFFIEQNPTKGILDSPIDAVFLTKFQIEGSVSKLKGITNEGSDSDEIFFTDFLNSRVLQINAMTETLMGSFAGLQLGTPIAISKSGEDLDEFTISDWSENKIIQTANNGTVLQTFDVQGLFEKPEYLTVDQATDDIYVTDSLNRTISILDDFGIFNSPKGIAVDKNSDTVYVVDEQDGEVKVFDSSGIFEQKFGTVGLNNGQFDQPNDVAVNSTNIFVADTNNNRIQIFDKDNNFVLRLGAFGGDGTAGNGTGEFDKPAGISVNDTHIFVADTNNNRIQIFNQTQDLVLKLGAFGGDGTAGSGDGEFNQPRAVANNVTHTFVADTFNNRIQIFSSSGAQTTSFGTDVKLFLKSSTEIGGSEFGVGAGLFNLPSGIAVNDTHILVSDTGNNIIQVLNHTGDHKKTIGGPGTGDGEFSSPMEIALDSLGNIYVSDTGNKRIQKLDSAGNFIEEWKSSINARFGDFIERFELYLPSLQAGALDVRDVFDENRQVMIGDWTPENERIIVANALGGKIAKHDVSQITQEPHSLAFNADEIFVTDPSAKNIVVVDTSTGDNLRNITTASISNFNISPTGIMINDIPQFPGENIFVYDNDTAKIFSITENPDTASQVFDAKELFVNLNDIAANNTHVFGLDVNKNKSSIVQIRWDKGIQEEVPISNDITGISIGVNGESDLIFFTTANSNNELLSYDRTTDTTESLIDLGGMGIIPSGITTIPMISTLVNVRIDDVATPSGITYSPDNEKLYVSEFSSTGTIKVFNATTFGLIETITNTAISFPTDLVFGPNGTLFVASYGNDKVLEINFTDNNSVETFAHGGHEISYPVGLAVSPDSKELYVSSSQNDEITKHALVSVSEIMSVDYDDKNGVSQTYEQEILLQQKGDPLGKLVDSSNSNSLANVQDITIGPDDKLYAASFNSDEILRWNLDGTFDGVFVQANDDSVLDGPSFLAFSDDGTLFVSSSKNNQVIEYDGATGGIAGIVTDETAKVPDGIAPKPDGNILVSSRSSGSILEYGKLESKFYVSDWSNSDNHRIIGLNETGHKKLEISLNDLGLVNPQNIVADNKAKLWIADAGSPPRLVQINPVSNMELESLDVSNIIIDPAPAVTLVEDSEPPVYVDGFGNNYTSIPQNVTTSITPKGISVDKNDRLYVTDWDNTRITQLGLNGTFFGQIKVNSTFTEPMDIAINHTANSDKLNDIWVFDENFESNGPNFISLDVEKQFKKIEFEDELSPLLRGLASNDGAMITTPSNSGSLFVINANLTAFFDSKHFIIPLGIDIEDDSIYVSDWKEKRIVKLDKSEIDFEEEFDYKLVGFPTSELGDLEVSENLSAFWITEPRRAVIDMIGFNGTITKYISVGDKYVAMADVVSDLEDNFFVASTNDTSIKKFDIRGTLLADFELTLEAGDHMEDIALGPLGSELVYLAIAGNNNEIKKFNSTDLNELGASFVPPFEPKSITVDNNGSIYISKSDLEVKKYDENFAPIDSFFVDQVNGMISDMVVDSENNLYAADKTFHRVYKYDLEENELKGWLGKCDTTSSENDCITESLHSKGFTCSDDPGSCSTDAKDDDNIPNNGEAYGRGIGQFFGPNDLTIDGLGNIYVSDVKLSPTQIDASTPDATVSAELKNVPRVQKFSKEGFFINSFVSDLDNSLVKGNFEEIKGIAYGKNNFYVADVEKLHVFDVNPFRNIKFNASTGNTTAQVTYESLIDIVDENDSFLYSVFDGFDRSMNIGTVDIEIVDPDPDGDGIFGDIDMSNDIDLSNVTSTEFESSRDGTLGNITDRGDQILIVREARDPEKGLFIQADIRETGDLASVNLCENLAEIELTPGDRVIATCILANNSTEGVELEVLRGELKGKFFDGNGRTSSYIIPVDNIIFMGQEPFEFTAGKKNFDTITQNVTFNGEWHLYQVPKDKTVRVDTAPPLFPEENCIESLSLEAESDDGVTWSGFLEVDNDSETGQFQDIKDFLDFNSNDVDNGDPQETEGQETVVTHNAPLLFVHDGSDIPTETLVEFTTKDKVGNLSTCTNSVFVRDRDEPALDFGDQFNSESGNGLLLETITSSFSENGEADLVLETTTSRFSETGRAFFDLPKIIDLPDDFNSEVGLEVENKTSQCSIISGSSVKISPKFDRDGEDVFIDTRVVCSGSDTADNLNDVESIFLVRVKPHPEGFGINKVIAVDNPVSSDPSPGLTLGDLILVQFTMPTNRPPVSTNADLDDIFELQNGTLGNNAQGSWINPSNLLIKFLDVSPPLDLVEGVTSFDLKFNPAFTSAGALINSSGTLLVENPIILGGDFTEPNPPFISAFIAIDPSLDSNDLRNDMGYSKGDTFTIRFSEPVQHPFSINPGKNQIDSMFSFSHELGEDYSGVWKNRSTLVITVDKVLNQTLSQPPILGTSTATVIGDIKNRAGTSENSNSVSPPLSGTYGNYQIIMDINKKGTLTQTLPSGITLGINFPNGTTVTMFKVDITARQNIVISEFLDITITNSTTDCEMGCDVTFWIHQSEFDEFGVSVDALRILHDANDDGVFDFNESLVPEIEEITTNLFSVTVKLFSFSSIALGAVPGGGGGGGDDTPPSFESWDYISCDPAIGCGTHIIKEIKFVTDMPTAIIPTEHSAKFILRVNENSGPNALQHVTLYTNIRGFADGIPDSDTFVRYDKGKPITVQDPHGFLSDAQVSVMPRGNNIDVIFTLLFDKPMEKSDIIIRAWDQSRNSRDARFADAIQVIPGIAEGPKFGGILGDSEPKGPIIDAEPIFSYNLFRDWAGFSDGQLSDSEFLSHLEIDGKKIPSWFKQNISKWVLDEMLSQQEFIDALRFLSDEGLL